MTITDYHPLPQVLCVGASPRKGGNTDVILDALSRRFQVLDIPCTTIRLREYEISPCLGCEGCRNDHVCRGCEDDMQALYPAVIAARAMVLVSPTHHYNITAWMKAFIDRMYCFYTFGTDSPRRWSSCLAGQDRIAALIAVCEQKDKTDMGVTLEAMEKPMRAFGYRIIGESAIFGIFKKAGVSERPGEMKKIEGLANAVVEAMSRKGETG